jgi:hypothetical protein
MVARIALLTCVLFAVFACDHKSPAVPVVPSPLPVRSNSAPVISAAVSPEFGIEQLTMFTARVEVRDPDGDGVTLTGRHCALLEESPVPLTDGVGSISSTDRGCNGFQLTATDARGARTEQWVSIHAVGLSLPYDLWIGTPPPGSAVGQEAHFIGSLKQSGTIVTGDIFGMDVGVVDPDAPGTIDATGRFRIRFKVGATDDLEITGHLTEPSGRIIGVGTVTGPRFNGRPFQLMYHDPY